MSFQNLSWLLMGMGIGIMLGREELGIFLFGGVLLLTGFTIHFIEERKCRKGQQSVGGKE